MILSYNISKLELETSSYTGTKTYKITGTRDSLKLEIELSQPEWDALCGWHAANPSVGDGLEIEMPGDLPEEEEEGDDDE